MMAILHCSRKGLEPMATREQRVTSLETADTVTRRQLAELTALMGTSFLNIHHEFDRLYE